MLTSTIPGESPPPAPRACFGRDELIEKLVGLTENLTPIALVGAGGIGKTSIVLTVLHHHRVKQRFGENRRFIRCDQFPATLVHLLSQLSKVTGAGVENPEGLAPLYPFLSSREALIVFDNAESILDPRGTDAAKIYAMMGELSRLETICLCITSRLSTIPPECEIVDIPTLSINAARDAFHRIYRKREQSNLISKILEQLDFHPLSITLLATVAHQNRWSTDRLMREWEVRRTNVLRTDHEESLAATIELSLASPLFQGLGPDARALLEVVAFFPQGVDENNLDWLFPTIPDRASVFDKVCALSLAYRIHGFVTMLAPLRDYLHPKDPKSSSLLCTTKEQYFTRMSVDIDPNNPSFGESRWIMSEDVNVEHLVDVFITIDANSDRVWRACADFMKHLYWHKNRHTILNPKIEGLPDDHCRKPECLVMLSWLFRFLGNLPECKRLLTYGLRLQREQGGDEDIAIILGSLASINRHMCFTKEGILQAKEALEIFKRLGNTGRQASCLTDFAWLLCDDKQFDAAEEAALRAINIISEEGNQFVLCQSHQVLGDIYQSKGEAGKAIHHFEVAFEIASPLDWHSELFCILHSLAELFYDEGRFEDANVHIERAKSYTVNIPYHLGHATELQAWIWYKQHRLGEARSEALHAAEIYEKIGATKDVEDSRKLLQSIEKELDTPPVTPSQSDFDCELL